MEEPRKSSPQGDSAASAANPLPHASIAEAQAAALRLLARVVARAWMEAHRPKTEPGRSDGPAQPGVILGGSAGPLVK